MDDNLNVEKFTLGETNEEFFCFGEVNNQKITATMIQQTELHLDILSHEFDPAVYDNPECCDAIEALALQSRHSRIRILLHHSKKASQQAHSIIQLGKRLGRLIQFRTVAEVHKKVQETFLLADGIGYIYRPYADSLTATVNFKDRPRVKEFSQLFDKIWNEGEIDLETRHLIL